MHSAGGGSNPKRLLRKGIPLEIFTFGSEVGQTDYAEALSKLTA